jgi:hypothetical protein
MSVAATAGAAAWVVPEILTAKPAAGATMSGVPSTSGSTSTPTTSPATTGGSGASVSSSPATSPGSLAFSGIDIQRDVEIGAALIAGGWAMHHWASRTPKPATETVNVSEAGEAGSQVDPT